MFRRPIGELLSSMSSAEFAFWEQVSRTEFIGYEREDYQAARIECSVKNYAGKVQPDGVSVSPLDCMPFSAAREPVRELTDEEQAENIKMVFMSLCAVTAPK